MPESCERCHRPVSGSRYHLGQRVCLRCALIDRVMLTRSTRVAVVVGTLLVLINQGDMLFGSAELPGALAWKIPLTYAVPFCVATYGALGNARRR